MTINTTWKVENIECLTQTGELENVVYNVAWRVFASDGTVETSVYGANTLGAPTGENFIPYSELTEETVLGWVYSAMGEEQKVMTENSAISAVELILAPKVVSKPLPWA